MRKLKVIILFIILVLIISTISFAHPGRTDSNGGHYDRSTGEYHYHGGEKVQNIVTENNKNTNQYKETQNNNNRESKVENNTRITNNIKEKDSTNDDNSFIIIIIIVIGILILWKTNPFKKK